VSAGRHRWSDREYSRGLEKSSTGSAEQKCKLRNWAARTGQRPRCSRLDARLAVATKCTFCVERIAAGMAQGLVPGVDHAATPACVNSCIASALVFGDLDDPQSNVSALLAENQHFRMHEELGTGPGFYYVWDKAAP
jgi:Fe-S-cluster-containing dehydrogenase component